MARIRVENEYLDLDDFKPSLKLGANQIGDLSKKNASYTVNFKIPWTSRNKRILNNIGETNINTLNANGKVDNVFLDFGSVEYKGFLRVVNSVPNVYYEVYFATDVSEWTDLIKSNNLQDLNLSRYDHRYNVDDIQASLSNTEGYIYPFVNYGFWNNLFQDYVSLPQNNYDTKYNSWFPAVYSKTILEQCFSDIGWSIDVNSELLKEPRFQRDVVLFSQGKFEYKKADADKTSVGLGINYPAFSPPMTGLPILAPFQIKETIDLGRGLNIGLRNAHLWDNTTSTYTVPFDGRYRWGDLYFAKGSSIIFDIDTVYIYVNSVLQETYPLGNTGGLHKNLYFTAQAGDEVQLYVSGGIGDTYKYCTMVNLPLQIAEGLEIPYDGIFTLASMLPTMSQTDFIKEIATSYGCVLHTNSNNKTVRFDLFKSITTKRINAVDWTHKLDKQSNTQIDYQSISKSYGKRNYFRYKQNDSDDAPNRVEIVDYNDVNQDVKLGDGLFNIDNEFLNSENTVYTSKFGSSLELSTGVDMTANEPILTTIFVPYAERTVSFTDGSVTAIDTKLTSMKTPRRAIVIPDVDVDLILKGVVSGVQIGNVDNSYSQQQTTLPFCYFVKTNKGSFEDENPNPLFVIDDTNYNLSFDTLSKFNSDKGLIHDYWEEQINIINNGYTVNVLLRLKEADVINLDFTQPFRLNDGELNGLFIINKIPKLDDFNSSIEVELIKI